MNDDQIRTTFVDMRHAEREWPDLHVFYNHVREECLPGDPPIRLDEYVNTWKTCTNDSEPYSWIVRAGEDRSVVANAGTCICRGQGDNSKLIFAIDVLPAYRRRGIGRMLLTKAREFADREGVVELLGVTNGRVPAGSAFMERIRAIRTWESRMNELDVARDLNHDLIRQWLDGNRGFDVEFHEGLFDHDQALAYSNLYDASFGRSASAESDEQRIARALRDDDLTFARGGGRLIAFLRDRETSGLVAFSVVTWNHARPEILEQEGTGVVPTFRGQGLSKIVKAAMIDKLLRREPPPKFVRTRNASSNAAILAVNAALGFRSAVSETRWRVTVEAVSAYLGTR